MSHLLFLCVYHVRFFWFSACCLFLRIFVFLSVVFPYCSVLVSLNISLRHTFRDSVKTKDTHIVRKTFRTQVSWFCEFVRLSQTTQTIFFILNTVFPSLVVFFCFLSFDSLLKTRQLSQHTFSTCVLGFGFDKVRAPRNRTPHVQANEMVSRGCHLKASWCFITHANCGALA